MIYYINLKDVCLSFWVNNTKLNGHITEGFKILHKFFTMGPKFTNENIYKIYEIELNKWCDNNKHGERPKCPICNSTCLRHEDEFLTYVIYCDVCKWSTAS